MTGLGSSCGACKFLRRKCASDCVFAPYFCYDEAATHFAAVHKVFGASNVSKLLSHLPVQNRSDAAITISYEALARMRDPVYGCVAHIFALQQQVARLQEEIDILESQMATVASCTTAGYGSSQATLNPICMQHFHSQEDVMNTQHSQNQPAALLNYSGFTTGIQAFDCQMDVQLPALYRWEELNPFCDYQGNPLEGVLEGIDKEILSYCSWFDSTN